jgi:hypothetical protein
MKKIKLLIITTIVVFLSCENSDKNLLENSNSLTESVSDLEDSYSKIETEYVEGDIKEETLFSEGDFKNETLADQETLELITAKLNENFSKQVVYNKTSNLETVGVFKNGTCGSYKELEVFMDSEDSRNASNKVGFTGSSSIDNRGNVTLSFCIVDNNPFIYIGPTSPFSNITAPVSYAVLNINASGGSYTLNRHFDNEDGGNINKTTYDGSTINALGSNSFGRNTLLSFKAYGPTDGQPFNPFLGYPIFPNIGVSYAVLGDVYSNRNYSTNFGYISSDDEDSSNANYCDRILSNGSTTRVSGSVSNLLIADRNTTMYFTKVR